MMDTEVQAAQLEVASLSAMLPQTGQGSLGLLMTLMGLLIVLCWLPLATRMSHQGQPV